MRYALILLALLIPSLATAQGRPQSVDIDQIEDVRLGDEGMRVLRFETDYVGRLRADIFSAPESAGIITVEFRERGASSDAPTGKTAAPQDVFGAGDYEAVVQAATPGAAIIQLRLVSEIPLDEFEDNNSLETAYRVELPFNGLVHISGRDRDWFRIDPASGGIVGVHLHTDYQFEGPQLGFYDHNGTLLYETDATPWGHRGMRYVRAAGRPIYVVVWDSNDYGEGDVTAFKNLEIVQYSPEGAPASSRSLVTLGLESEDPASFQLDLIGRAIGVDTVAANEAEGIARELKVAIEGRGGSLRSTILWALLALVLGLAGLSIWWQRHRMAQIKARNPEPEKSD